MFRFDGERVPDVEPKMFVAGYSIGWAA